VLNLMGWNVDGMHLTRSHNKWLASEIGVHGAVETTVATRSVIPPDRGTPGAFPMDTKAPCSPVSRRIPNPPIYQALACVVRRGSDDSLARRKATRCMNRCRTAVTSTARTDCRRETKFAANPLGITHTDLDQWSVVDDICGRNENLGPTRPCRHRQRTQCAREIVGADMVMRERAAEGCRELVAVFDREDMRVYTVGTITGLRLRCDDVIVKARRRRAADDDKRRECRPSAALDVIHH